MWARRNTGNVVGIGRMAEADQSFVNLVIRPKILREPGSPAEQERKHTRGIRVESPKMSNLSGAGETPHLVHNVVRRPALRFVNDYCADQVIARSLRILP